MCFYIVLSILYTFGDENSIELRRNGKYRFNLFYLYLITPFMMKKGNGLKGKKVFLQVIPPQSVG